MNYKTPIDCPEVSYRGLMLFILEDYSAEDSSLGGSVTLYLSIIVFSVLTGQ